MKNIKTCIGKILIDNYESPVVIVNPTPKYSFIIESNKNGIYQRRYKIKVGNLKGTVFWDSDWVNSNNSFNILHSGTPLMADESYCIEIEVETELEHFSKKSYFSTGLFATEDKAKWIGAKDECSPFIRNTFCFSQKVKDAKIYISCTDFYRIYVNEKLIASRTAVAPITKGGNYFLECYDILDKITDDVNTFGAWLCTSQSGKFASFCMVVSVTYFDGTREKFYTDENWVFTKSPITSFSQQGEVYNINLVYKKWCSPFVNTERWGKVTVQDLPPAIPLFADKIGRLSSTEAKKFAAKDEETTFCDFGFSAFGRIKIIITGEPGAKVIIKYYNSLQGSQNESKDVYIIKGYEIEAFEPRFSGRVFRYADVKIDGVAQLIYTERINIGTLTKRTVYFDSVSESVKEYYKNLIKDEVKTLANNITLNGLCIGKNYKAVKSSLGVNTPLILEEALLTSNPEYFCNMLFLNTENSEICSAAVNIATDIMLKIFNIRIDKERKIALISFKFKDIGDNLNVEYFSNYGKFGFYIRKFANELHQDFVIPIGGSGICSLPDGTIKTLTNGKYLYEQL